LVLGKLIYLLYISHNIIILYYYNLLYIYFIYLYLVLLLVCYNDKKIDKFDFLIRVLLKLCSLLIKYLYQESYCLSSICTRRV